MFVTYAYNTTYFKNYVNHNVPVFVRRVENEKSFDFNFKYVLYFLLYTVKRDISEKTILIKCDVFFQCAENKLFFTSCLDCDDYDTLIFYVVEFQISINILGYMKTDC